MHNFHAFSRNCHNEVILDDEIGALIYLFFSELYSNQSLYIYKALICVDTLSHNGRFDISPRQLRLNGNQTYELQATAVSLQKHH